MDVVSQAVMDVAGQALRNRGITGHGVGEATHAADAVRHGHDGALIADVSGRPETFDAALDEFGNFSGIQLHEFSPVCAFTRSACRASE